MKTEPTWYANIWIAGDYEQAIDSCRHFCMEVPQCVTVTKTDFVYHGGMESGVCVRLIQYPRFPDAVENLELIAEDLAERLRADLYQHSYSIEYPDRTIWESSRPEPV